MSERDELERLRAEAAALRDLVRALSAAQASAVGALPLEPALALARGALAGPESRFALEGWNETIEMTPADVAPEMELLWKKLPPREGA